MYISIVQICTHKREGNSNNPLPFPMQDASLMDTENCCIVRALCFARLIIGASLHSRKVSHSAARDYETHCHSLFCYADFSKHFRNIAHSTILTYLGLQERGH